jgi:hypothetical protein
MAATITCPGCGLRGQIPESLNTPTLRCPRCGTTVPNPAKGGSAPPPPPTNASPGPLLDEFFARAYAAPAVPQTGTPPIPPVAASLPPMPVLQVQPVAAPLVAAPPPPDPPVAPPNGATTGSPHAEEQWVREERQRLEAYMSKHFALLQQQREEFSKWRTQVEAALVGREQELNRQQRLIGAQNETLQQRTAELGERESTVTRQIEEVSSTGAQVLQEVEAEKQRLEQIRTEIEQARQEQSELEAGLAPQKQAMEGRLAVEKKALEAQFAKDKQAMEAERAAWVQQGAKRKELQDTFAKTEAALRRRVSEAMNLEAQIYHELERQEQRLAIERRHLEQTRQDLLAISDEKTELRRKVITLSQELEKLRRAAPPTSR